MAVKAVFFDFTGTLADVHPDVGAVYARLAEQFGLQVSPPQMRQAFHRVFPHRPPLAFPPTWPEAMRRQAERAWWRAVVADVLVACGVFPHQFDFEGYFEALYAAFETPKVWRLRPEAPAVLAELHRRAIAVAVVSNFDSRLERLVQHLGIDAWVSVVVYSSQVGSAKPDPHIFWRACEWVGVMPEEALHIGDDPYADYYGARQAGLQARCFRASSTDAVIPSISTLSQVLTLVAAHR